ncbi:hypothetical protein JKP88DRAFT_262991 [Tribonema minus]|uniref:Peptidase C19 ubiquitin carboxyl-terminal hydrolase domain-containing protein n=1 Tax=Tribonema minus TaxID=303371 RepID=A0A836CH23_9STRA|nr:hypothetical protein JKP88DRAFT_262991 [Tribonema minus]
MMLFLGALTALVMKVTAAPVAPVCKAPPDIIDDHASAMRLTEATVCPGQNITVKWRGFVGLTEPIIVGNGTSLVIDGVGTESDPAAISGQNKTQVLHVQKGASVTLRHLELRVGRAMVDGISGEGGAVRVFRDGQLLVEACQFRLNRGGGLGGGAIYNEGHVTCLSSIFAQNTAGFGGAITNFGNFTVDGSTFTWNKAERDGGAIHNNDGGNFSCINSTFVFNTGEFGGAILNNGDFTCRGSIFTSNKADTSGGAMYNDDSGNFNCSKSTLTDNTSDFGGAIYHEGIFTCIGSNFTSNKADENGGAILNSNEGDFNCSNSTLTDNTSDHGGAISNEGSFACSGSIFTSNKAGWGGAIENANGTFNCSNSKFVSNTGNSGGAIVNLRVFTCSGSKFTSNEAGERAGAVFNDGKGIFNCSNSIVFFNTGDFGGATFNKGNFTCRGSIFTSNKAATSGGAIYNDPSGVYNCRKSTLTDNTSDNGGAIFNEGVCTCSQTIFTSNKAGGVYNCRKSTLTDNTSGNGGAIFNEGVCTCSQTIFTSNRAGESGGAISNGIEGNLNCSNSTLTDNISKGTGAAIMNAGSANCSDVTFTGNKGADGGAIRNVGGFNIIGSAFSFNEAPGVGGAISTSYGDFICSNVTFTDNKAGVGGAITIINDGGFDCSDSTFTRNTAKGDGGAIYHEDGILKCTNSEFTNNYAGEEGTGSSLFAEVDNATTFTDNSAECCYAGGQNSGIGSSCLDVSTGYEGGWECCGNGQYIGAGAVDGTFGCKACDSTGLACTGIGATIATLPLDSGYWRETLMQELIRKCWNSDACIGSAAAASVDDYCAAGYEGPYCTVCSADYAALVGYRCVECTTTSVAIALSAIAAIAIVVMFLAWVLVRAVGEAHTATDGSDRVEATNTSSRVARTLLVLMRRLRVPIVVLQVLTQYVSITGGDLPLSYTHFLNGVSIFSLDLRWLTSPGCAMNVNFYDRLLMATLSPLAIIALIFAGRLYLIARAQFGRTPHRSHATLQLLVSEDLNAAFGFTFLIFAGVSVTVFETFACDELQYVGSSYLRVDYSIECYTPEHTAYRIFAGVMLLFYPIGIPALYMGTLWLCFVARRDHGQTSQLAKASLFLWEPYQANVFYWEVVECVRRLMLTGLLVFIMPGTPGQSAVACVFAVFTGIGYESMRPHRDSYDMWLYRIGYSIVFVSYFLSLLMQVSFTDEASETIVGNLLVALNVLLLVMALGQAVLVLTSGAHIQGEDWRIDNAADIIFGDHPRTTFSSDEWQTKAFTLKSKDAETLRRRADKPYGQVMRQLQGERKNTCDPVQFTRYCRTAIERTMEEVAERIAPIKGGREKYGKRIVMFEDGIWKPKKGRAAAPLKKIVRAVCQRSATVMTVGRRNLCSIQECVDAETEKRVTMHCARADTCTYTQRTLFAVLSSLPRVIVLLLMRQNAAVSGAEEGWQAAKMTHHVSPNTRLTMPDGTLYTLKAVVHHTGDAVDRGHNLTIAHTAEGWCKFDGDVVERSSTPETQQPVGAHVTAAVYVKLDWQMRARFCVRAFPCYSMYIWCWRRTHRLIAMLPATMLRRHCKAHVPRTQVPEARRGHIASCMREVIAKAPHCWDLVCAITNYNSLLKSKPNTAVAHKLACTMGRVEGACRRRCMSVVEHEARRGTGYWCLERRSERTRHSRRWSCQVTASLRKLPEQDRNADCFIVAQAPTLHFIAD